MNTRYYDPEIGQFISPDSLKYLNPGAIGGVNLYAYCNYNPVIRTDPTGTDWDWGVFWDVFINVGAAAVAIFAGVTVGLVAGAPLGILTGLAIFGAINNTVNAIYYHCFSDGVSSIFESDSDQDPSYYVENGYISRWERLDYAKQMAGSAGYANAWRYYGEYSFHMYAWLLFGNHIDDGSGFLYKIARSAFHANIDPFNWEADENGNWSWRNIFYILFGIGGI